ncbi:septation protein SepH [Nakamurella sp.]|uniref:septation protein SepH n=1 Tax=Nakamurella sp. TaxID=1869182 RepID=UPI003B3BBAA3
MRALRVLGMAEDGENLLCEDTVTGEVFSLRSDERLRAAARGELKGSGRRAVETDPQLRPKEIQARIRAGKTVAVVAAEAVTSVSRIESYAYPVMLERASMADKARAAHPMIDGNPTRKTLEELVTATLRQRGQADSIRWDAYKPQDAGWIVAVHWQAGRSDNQATWEIHTGSRTTTLRSLDDAARELLDPAPRPLRTIAESAGDPAAARVSAGPVEEPPLFGQPEFEPPAAAPQMSRHPAGSRRAEVTASPAAPSVDARPGDTHPTPNEAPSTTAAGLTGTDQTPTRPARRGQRPVMPGWEDILLGGHSKG